MLQTIQTGKYISIQGEFVRDYPDGSVMVRVGPSYYVGKPVISSLKRPDSDDDLKAVNA